MLTLLNAKEMEKKNQSFTLELGKRKKNTKLTDRKTNFSLSQMCQYKKGFLHKLWDSRNLMQNGERQ